MPGAFENEKSPNVFIGHGYTHSGHPVGTVAVLTCLAETKRLNVIENAAARGTELFDGQCSLKERHEQIVDVRGGHGLMLAIECVSDRTTKAADMVLPFRVQNLACEKGAMVRATGPNLLMSPPMALTSEDVQTIPAALDAGFAAT